MGTSAGLEHLIHTLGRERCSVRSEPSITQSEFREQWLLCRNH